MTTQAEVGMNRTGVATSPELCERMVEGTIEFLSDIAEDDGQIAEVREQYGKGAEPLGSVPPPATLSGALETAAQGLLRRHPSLFIDKLGERLAFERSGVRLYEALLTKFDSQRGFDGGPERSELERMMMEEYEHFRMLSEAVSALGGDPTVLTPSADVQATIGHGPLAIIVDPRTTFAQCLEALLVVELADNACWGALVELATRSGEEELASQFAAASAEEDEHLALVNAWVAGAQERSTDAE